MICVRVVHVRRLRYLGHAFRSEVPPAFPHDPFEPNQTLRFILLNVKSSTDRSAVSRRHFSSHLSHIPLLEADGGASPHVVDFPIDVGATYVPGTLFELIPHFETFSGLWTYLTDRGGSDEEIKRIWHTEVDDIVVQWSIANGLMPHIHTY
jgi:hypothetical protein